MFKIFKEKIEERKEKEEDRQRFLKLGMEFLLKKEPYIAIEYFRKGGLKEKEIEALIGDPKEIVARQKPETKIEDEKEPMELDEMSKLRLKDLGLTSLAKNQTDFAKLCFQAIELPKKEIDLLLELNLLGIEREQKKIKKDLEEMGFGK